MLKEILATFVFKISSYDLKYSKHTKKKKKKPEKQEDRLEPKMYKYLSSLQLECVFQLIISISGP